jgi:hypothetical protein
MPEQERKRKDFYYDGFIEVVEINPYYCEFCNLEHNKEIKMRIKFEDEHYILSGSRCDRDIIKWGDNEIIEFYSHLE